MVSRSICIAVNQLNPNGKNSRDDAGQDGQDDAGLNAARSQPGNPVHPVNPVFSRFQAINHQPKPLNRFQPPMNTDETRISSPPASIDHQLLSIDQTITLHAKDSKAKKA
jgi:hypothetical protein